MGYLCNLFADNNCLHQVVHRGCAWLAKPSICLWSLRKMRVAESFERVLLSWRRPPGTRVPTHTGSPRTTAAAQSASWRLVWIPARIARETWSGQDSDWKALEQNLLTCFTTLIPLTLFSSFEVSSYMPAAKNGHGCQKTAQELGSMAFSVEMPRPTFLQTGRGSICKLSSSLKL